MKLHSLTILRTAYRLLDDACHHLVNRFGDAVVKLTGINKQNVSLAVFGASSFVSSSKALSISDPNNAVGAAVLFIMATGLRKLGNDRVGDLSSNSAIHPVEWICQQARFPVILIGVYEYYCNRNNLVASHGLFRSSAEGLATTGFGVWLYLNSPSGGSIKKAKDYVDQALKKTTVALSISK